MPVFEECCVLIPAATLEDFPSDLSDYDARSLLSAWTVLWHPHLIATTGRLPSWYRADSPPDPKPGWLFVVPAPSLTQLPADFQSRVESTHDCRWVTGSTREELWEEICKTGSPTAESDNAFPLGGPAPAIRDAERAIDVADFYAAGYASLQIQVMTRRLRYTSNLDEIHLQNRAVQGAESFRSGNAGDSIAALHDVFDALAEERDHYFSSSDPHLVDLTLATSTTVDSLLDQVGQIEPTPEDDGVLATPGNVLIDQDVAEVLGRVDDERVAKLRQAIAGQQLGWAGGGPSESLCLDRMTLASAEAAIARSTAVCQQAIGAPPLVFARYTGGWAGDLNSTLASLGYAGIIPIDFARGTGHGDEAKVLLETGSGPLEALTARPIDASSDASFLNLGAKLGESIDSGEIATALLVHWPGAGCQSLADVRRAATWSLCLGKFWTLQDYFQAGESPYHHGNLSAASQDSGAALDVAIDNESSDPISSAKQEFCRSVTEEQASLVVGLADLVHGSAQDQVDPWDRFAAAVLGAGSRGDQATMLVNPAPVGQRWTVETAFGVSTDAKHVYACSNRGSDHDVTVDVPAFGFVVLRPDAKAPKSKRSIAQRFRRSVSLSPRPIANKDRSDGTARLVNEFMEIVISPGTGGVSGVYSGAVRGNRFSMKLIGRQSPVVGSPVETVMQCDSIKTDATSLAVGRIAVTGRLIDAKQNRTLAGFSLEYRLTRGSRLLHVTGELTPEQALAGNPWDNHFALRTAVSGEAAIYRPLIRDKVHRRRSRKLVAPLGVLIDEAERQTLVATCGLPYHRIVGERFLDTLVQVQGESQRKFALAYGFDVPAPVPIARSLICPPDGHSVAADSDSAPIGWIVHSSPSSVDLSQLQVRRNDLGQLTAHLQLVQTRSQPCTAKVRFLRDVESAVQIVTARCAAVHEPDQAPVSAANPDHRVILDAKEDRVTVSLPAHGVANLEVVFRD